jgi:hypothetical protein
VSLASADTIAEEAGANARRAVGNLDAFQIRPTRSPSPSAQQSTRRRAKTEV